MSFKFIPNAVAAAAAMVVAGSQAATINLIDLGGVAGSQAEQGFQIAAQYWGNMFTNNVTINLGVSFAPLAPNVIGSTGSRSVDQSVASWQTAFNATRSNSTIDQTLVLPTLSGGGVTALTTGVDGSGNNDVSVTAVLNSSQTASRVLWQNSAVVKAVGGTLSNPGQRDGNVTFSSNFSFDFDARDGISAGTFDFVGVAIHEIGHALGFVSGVDTFDYFSSPNGPANGILGYDINDTSIFSALDMFRYSAPGQLDFRVGGTKYFSIDGGQTALFNNLMATGSFNGDGDQASHWQDTAGCSGVASLGIMDPTFCFGQTGFVKALDLAAFDAMGWNLSVDALTYQGESTADIMRRLQVPEPGTWALMFAALGLMGASRRKRA